MRIEYGLRITELRKITIATERKPAAPILLTPNVVAIFNPREVAIPAIFRAIDDLDPVF